MIQISADALFVLILIIQNGTIEDIVEWDFEGNRFIEEEIEGLVHMSHLSIMDHFHDLITVNVFARF
jgi:hypothetical protein